MSDDSFIREVDEELRSARFQDFWKKYGTVVIGLAIAIVLLTGGYRYWEYYTAQTAAKAGDQFMAAVRLSREGKQEESVVAFKELENSGGGTYRVLALMRSASDLAAKGDVAEAIKKFDTIVADNKADQNMRSIARIRAGMLLVDSGTVAEVETRVSPLSAPGAPFRSSAREAMGLAHFKAGDLENAFKQFEAISEDGDAPSAIRQRVRIMLDLIASRGGPVVSS